MQLIPHVKWNQGLILATIKSMLEFTYLFSLHYLSGTNNIELSHLALPFPPPLKSVCIVHRELW